jgi:hypothetical protein
MTSKLQAVLEDFGIEWPALKNHILCMVPVMELAVSAFMSSLSVQGRSKSWETHERDQQFGENEA